MAKPRSITVVRAGLSRAFYKTVPRIPSSGTCNHQGMPYRPRVPERRCGLNLPWSCEEGTCVDCCLKPLTTEPCPLLEPSAAEAAVPIRPLISECTSLASPHLPTFLPLGRLHKRRPQMVPVSLLCVRSTRRRAGPCRWPGASSGHPLPALEEPSPVAAVGPWMSFLQRGASKGQVWACHCAPAAPAFPQPSLHSRSKVSA